MVMKHSLSYSRETGIWTSIGIGLGILVHILYCFVGLGIVINNSPVLFNVIKYVGALYLLYLGIMSFISKVEDVDFDGTIQLKVQPGALKSLRIGFLTNVLNPKATLFFLSLFTLVISPDTPYGILFIISIILVGNTMLWFVFLSYVITIRKVRIIFNRFQNRFNQVFGIILILVAIKIAMG